MSTTVCNPADLDAHGFLDWMAEEAGKSVDIDFRTRYIYQAMRNYRTGRRTLRFTERDVGCHSYKIDRHDYRGWGMLEGRTR